MSILVAVTHVAGVIIAESGLAVLKRVLGHWVDANSIKRYEAEIALKLGISIKELNSGDRQREIHAFFTEKYSSELFGNRISDFCGIILVSFNMLSSFVEIAAFLLIVWKSFFGTLGDIVLLWGVPVFGIVCLVVGVVFSLACSVLTGRFPGEAKNGRKNLLKKRRGIDERIQREKETSPYSGIYDSNGDIDERIQREKERPRKATQKRREIDEREIDEMIQREKERLRKAKQKEENNQNKSAQTDKSRNSNSSSTNQRDQQTQSSDTITPEIAFGKILGLNGKVSKHDIKTKYRELVQKYHPDKVSHLGEEFRELAHKKFKQINEAYEYFKAKYGIS